MMIRYRIYSNNNTTKTNINISKIYIYKMATGLFYNLKLNSETALKNKSSIDAKDNKNIKCLESLVEEYKNMNNHEILEKKNIYKMHKIADSNNYNLTLNAETALRKKSLTDAEYNKNLKCVESLVKEYENNDIYEYIIDNYKLALDDFTQKNNIDISINNIDISLNEPLTSLRYSSFESDTNDETKPDGDLNTNSYSNTNDEIKPDSKINYNSELDTYINKPVLYTSALLFVLGNIKQIINV